MSNSNAKRDAVTTLVTEQLAEDFDGRVDPEEVAHAVAAHADDFADARIPNFVPTLLARKAREELEAVAVEPAPAESPPPVGWHDKAADPDSR